MQIHVVDEAVVEELVLDSRRAFPRCVVDVRLLWGVLVREVSLVSSLHLHVLRNLVLVVEFHLPAAVVDVLRAVLVVVSVHVVALPNRRVAVEVVAVRLPAAEVDGEVEQVALAERVAVVELRVEHIHVAARACESVHEIVAESVSHGGVSVRCEALRLAFALHKHSAQAQVVLLRGVQRQSGACEEVVAPAVVVRLVALVVGVGGLRALGVACALAVAVAYVGICVQETAVVVDVETAVGAALSVGTCLKRTVVARLAVFLQHDVDDAGRAFS